MGDGRVEVCDIDSEEDCIGWDGCSVYQEKEGDAIAEVGGSFEGDRVEVLCEKFRGIVGWTAEAGTNRSTSKDWFVDFNKEVEASKFGVGRF